MKCHLCNNKLIYVKDLEIEKEGIKGINSEFICGECDASVEFFTPNGNKAYFTDYSNNRLRLALIGGARVGKDTIGKYLVDRHNFKRLAFGDELKRSFSEVFNDNVIETNKRRGDLIYYGQACREIDPLVWVNKVNEKFIKIKQHNPNQNIVITDVRQDNEIKWALENNFILVKVTANKEDILERALNLNERLDIHNELDQIANLIECFYNIDNTSTLPLLYERVEDLLYEIY